MCIICNLPEPQQAEIYLAAVERARAAMRDAEASLLAVAEHAISKDVRARYRTAHKAMVRARRAWNRAENSRETPRL